MADTVRVSEPATKAAGIRGAMGSDAARIWWALVALVIVAHFIAPGTLATSALLAMLPVTAILAVAAIGQSLTIQQGGIDFSVPGAMTLAAVLVTGVANTEDSKLVLGIVVALAAVLVAGLINGLAITALRITPIIATLAVNAILFGAVATYASASPQAATNSLSNFAAGRTLGLPNTVWVALVFVVVAIVIQSRTVMGRRFISIGSSPAASRAIGLPVTRYIVGTYVVAALCYGVAGIMLAGYVVSPSLALGNPYLLGTITAVVIGGTSFGGGRARLAGTAAAALFLSLLNSILNVLGAPPSATLLVQAGAIALAVGLGPVLAAVRRSLKVRSIARAAA